MTDARRTGDRAVPVRVPDRRLSLTFEAFHDAHHRAWLRFAHLQVGDRSAAEHVVEAAAARLAENWTHVLGQEAMQAYAWGVLKEHVAEWLQARGRPSAMVETAAFAAAVSRMLDVSRERFAVLESRIGLYSAISRLPERQYDVIVLRYVLGYSDPKVAWFLGIQENTVRSHARWAKRRLSKELGVAWRDGEPDGRPGAGRDGGRTEER
ncbi:SigE family RNA polymerase sigma factor [Streptomyces capparidis]